MCVCERDLNYTSNNTSTSPRVCVCVSTLGTMNYAPPHARARMCVYVHARVHSTSNNAGPPTPFTHTCTVNTRSYPMQHTTI